MSPDEERQSWELAGDGEPVETTSEPIAEEDRGAGAEGSADERRHGEPEEGGPEGDSPPPERSHEDEGELGAGSQYAAEDAGPHSEPRGPAGAAGGPN